MVTTCGSRRGGSSSASIFFDDTAARWCSLAGSWPCCGRAGVNRMPWSRFFLFNVAGGIVWAGLFGIGAYALGHRIHHVAGPVGMTALVLALAFCLWLFLF